MSHAEEQEDRPGWSWIPDPWNQTRCCIEIYRTNPKGKNGAPFFRDFVVYVSFQVIKWGSRLLTSGDGALGCRSPKCRKTKCRNRKCWKTKCWMTKCQKTKGQKTKCRKMECRKTKCRNTKWQKILKMSNSFDPSWQPPARVRCPPQVLGDSLSLQFVFRQFAVRHFGLRQHIVGPWEGVEWLP
jgi:hypothetical protein